jgi:hypothetical protein
VIAEIPPIESLREQASSRRSAWVAGIVAAMIVGFILAGSAAAYLYG